MKKLGYLIILMMIYCGPVKAQVLIALVFGDKLNTDKLEFGLVVSPSFTKISNIECNYKNGLNLSLYFNVKTSERFFIHLEALAKGSYGAKDIFPYATGSDTLDNLFAEGGILRKIKAFGLMTLGQYRITDQLYIEAGPQVNWMLKSKDIYESTYNGNDLTYTVPISDNVTTFEVGLTGGAGYRLRKEKGVSLTLRYYAGFTDIWKLAEGTQSNSMWTFNIGIPIGGNKNPNPKPPKKQ
jgi:hypothetical protein